MSLLKSLKISDDYSSLNAQDKFVCLVHLMTRIENAESIRKWRNRYATEEQLKEEYPPEYDKALSMAWISVKTTYLNDKVIIDEYVSKNKILISKSSLLYHEILKKFADEDLE